MQSINCILISLLVSGLILKADVFPLLNSHEGELNGAPYHIWSPAGFNNEILYVFAPGYRPDSAPRELVMDPLADETLAPRLEAGWTVATTLYRKNGWAVQEGIEDVLALVERAYEVAGPFRIVLIEGHSMGGLIAMHIAELAETPHRIHGVLAVGAPAVNSGGWLQNLGGNPEDLDFTFAPFRPLVFVSNENELRGPLHYLGMASENDTYQFAAVFTIERRGHVNLTAGERFSALEQLYNWVSGEPPTRLGDLTIAVPQAVGEGVLTGDVLQGRVVRVDPDYGNIDLSITLIDLAKLGLTMGDSLGIRFGEEERIARISDRYAGVPRGEWVAVILPDGKIRIAINHGNAAADLGIELGGEVFLSAVQ